MLLQSSSLAAVVLSSIVLVGYLAPVTEAHSWLECVNWQFHNPDKKDWSDKGGECLGYARRFPLGHKFASMDSSPARHYQQDNKNPNNALPCSDGDQGEEPGMDETLAEPRDAAYNRKGWGKMTVTKVGDEICLRWPAKTHGNEDSVVMVAISKNANGKDPTQKGFNSNIVAKLKFGNCSGSGGKDNTACGGCFPVPVRASGDYVLQWRWELNEDEFYTSCADLRIGSK
ncbi:hypothetical protein BGZ70_002150 [Mortierella alpina]|uniref:Secreted protein n=1 Tax=Mortierella alpina TaxID=64518 RepID=A0A9P6IV16_MORAP|nr:hypothetical protein BGZ70_002150 [Mortierella alpina]